MSSPREPERTGEASRAGPGGAEWAVALDRRLVLLCRQFHVAVEILDPSTARFEGLPVGPDFNKPRTNLLLRRSGLGSGSQVYVDNDLEYRGSDSGLAAAMTGSDRRNWRRLRVAPIAGSVNEALCSVLSLLESPMARMARRLMESAARQEATGAGDAGDAEEPIPGRLLAAFGERITAETAIEAYRSSVRKPLARQLAVLTTRQSAPRAAVLWGPSGAGRDHLMLAAAGPLLEAGQVERVYRLRGALLAAGCVLSQELDAGLRALLGEMAALEKTLLLVEDLDLCLSGSAVSYALLGGSLDRGLRMLATARNERFVRRLGRDEPLARRLVPVHVAEPKRSETIEILEGLARAAKIEVAPPAIQTAARVAAGPEAVQPATAVGLLSAALAEAVWEGRGHVGPDDVVAVLEGQWPKARAGARYGGEDPEEEGEEEV